MPEHHRGRVTEAKVVEAAWQASSSPNRKFGLHQPRGGNCHQQSWGLMCWIYALLSSSQCWKLEDAEVPAQIFLAFRLWAKVWGR